MVYCATLNQRSSSAFRKVGFIHRKSGLGVIAYTRECSKNTAQILADPANWFLTAADSNLDHEGAMKQLMGIQVSEK